MCRYQPAASTTDEETGTVGRFVFLMGHMRSGSSLLLHILASSPEIAGFGESHCSYGELDDLDDLRDGVARWLGPRAARSRYLLDKMLHDYIELGDGVLQCEDVFFVFLVREPRSAIASMMLQFPDWFTGGPLPNDRLFAHAVAHYQTRLEVLLDLAWRVGRRQRMLFITHQELIEKTAPVFRAIEDMLGLSEPLRETYELLPTTGEPALGDTSPHIRRKFIDRAKPNPTMKTDHPALDESERLFVEFSAAMRRRCLHV